MFKTLIKRIQVNRTIDALSRLDDKTLRDIGLSRSEITARALEVNR